MTPNRAAAPVLQIWVIAVFLVPSDMVLRPLGGRAHLANLIAMALGAWWLATTLLPRRVRPLSRYGPTNSPGAVHLAVALTWMATLGAWVALARRGGDDLTWNAAERWGMVVLAYSAVALVAVDGLRHITDLHRVAATAVAACAASSVVAFFQWRTSLDPSEWLRRVPGLTLVGDGTDTVMTRGEVGRVTGTALHPIEFGVAGALMIPVAIHLLVHDQRRHLLRRMVPLLLCALAVPLSVSRSGVVVAFVTVGVMILCLPPIPRLTAMAVAPVASVMVLLAAPGTASTLRTSFLTATEDSSVQARLDDFALVGPMIASQPWWGVGGGTYQPADLFEILDNQYLLGLVELGVAGGVLFAFATLIIPLHLAGVVRRRHHSEVVRSWGGAGLACGLGALVAWATFDAWAFPRFAAVSALLLGLVGAARELSYRWTPLPPPTPDSRASLGALSPTHTTTTQEELSPWTC